MVSFENGFTELKFGTDLHMKIHNVYVLARICSCCVDKDIHDGVQPPFSIIVFFQKIINFHSTEIKFGKYLPIKIPNECVFSRICKCCRGQDIQDGVQPPFEITVLCMKSI